MSTRPWRIEIQCAKCDRWHPAGSAFAKREHAVLDARLFIGYGVSMGDGPTVGVQRARITNVETNETELIVKALKW